MQLKLFKISFWTGLFFVFFNGNTVVYSQSKQFTKPLSFIENKGQFNNRNWQNTDIKYGYSNNPFYVFFTNKGLTYRFDKIIKNPNHKKGDSTTFKRINISELIQVEWINANQNVEIISSDPTNHFYSYAIKTATGVINKNNIKGFNKIVYKNIYDNIDVEYTIHLDGGIKYNIILHPGADINQVKLKYSYRHTNTKDEFAHFKINDLGQLEINTSLGQIIEHAPISFYDENHQEIQSSYHFDNQILSFNLGDYDASKTVIIDPWIVSPTYNSSTATWEVETDGAGNVYAIGGETPMELNKYNVAGVLQWVYTTPWDTNTVWLGTLATDNAGTSYITSGTTPEIERIDNAGNMIWHANGNGGFASSDEYWTITFNCDKTKLIVGGTKMNSISSFSAAVFEIDVSNGSVQNTSIIETNPIGFNTPIEVRSISSTRDAKYAFLTHNDVGTLNQNMGVCPTNEPYYKIDNGHNLAYKCENYLPATQNGGGLKALIANDTYIYTNSGDQVWQRDLNTGALINTVNLPGGNSTTSLGKVVVSNSGMAVDDCGNVYAGSGDRVVKFDQNLNILSQSNVGFTVYDVSVNSNGEVIACGAQQDNSANNRNGRIESINMSACAQYALVCCDVNVCAVDTVCVTDPSFNLVPNTPGGTWSGTGVDASGNFNPATAGVGVHQITYTLSCGSNTFNIVVSQCANLTACIETNGDITVNGGTGPYTWEESTVIGQNCLGVMVLGSCLGILQDVYGWVTLPGTSATETVSGSGPIIISDNGSLTTLYIADTTGLPSCVTPCSATINPAGPFCQNDAPVNLTAVNPGGTWSGTGITDTNLGTFDPAAAGVGSHTITYTLSGACAGNSDTENIIVNSCLTLSACLESNGDVTVSGSTAPYTWESWEVVGQSCTGTVVLGSCIGGSWVDDYGWVVFGGNSATETPPNNNSQIQITDGSGNSVVVNDVSTLSACSTPCDATITPVGPFCQTDASVNLVGATSGGTWSGTGITDANLGTFDPATAGPGTHTITYTLSGACAGTSNTIDIVVNAADDASFNYANASYCLSDPNPTPTITGTTGGTFTINNGGVINSTTGQIDITNSGAGSFDVTYTTNGTCPANSTVTITLTNGFNTTITPAGPFCENDATVNLTAVDGGGTWSGTGITDANLGTFDPATAGPGTHTITYTISGACGGSSTTDIVVNPQDIASISFANPTYCLSDNNPVPTITGVQGGTFTIDNGGTINSTTGEVDLNGTGVGTYTISYTTTGPCPTTVSTSVTIGDGGNVTITPVGPFCLTNDTITLSVNVTGGTWSGTGIVDNANGEFGIGVAGVGSHEIIYQTSGTCSDSDTINIEIYPQTVANVVPSIDTIDYGSSITLTASGGGTYTWMPDTDLSCSDCENPVASPIQNTTYCVVVDKNACLDTACTTIIVEYNCGEVFVPNAFSPNGDDANNLECVYGNCLVEINFRIYDRWGELVFETTDLNTCWDGTYKGKLLSSQVFVYLLDATLINGEVIKKKGNISLIR